MNNLFLSTIISGILILTGWFLTPFNASTVNLEKNDQPNIVFIFADDLSFRDLSAYGQMNYQTPNIDKLLGHATRFTQAYAGAPECAPSRGTMLTGLHVGHCPIRLNSSARGFEYLPDTSYTFAEMLQEQGYTTGVIGKWGLGYKDSPGQPLNQGFDYHYGYLTHYEAHSYFPLTLYENNKPISYPANTDMDIGTLYDKERALGEIDFESYYDDSGKLTYMNLSKAKYAPDLLDQKAESFIEKYKAQPFFLYYTANLPHGPPIVDDLRQLSNRRDIDIVAREWGAMVQRLDQSVGKLIQKLKAEGIYDNTYIIFASDNGYSMHGPSKNKDGSRVWKDDKGLQNKGPFKGGKFSVWEGGMRIPFFIQQPGQNTPQIISQPVWLVDLFPTLGAIANAPKLPSYLDGYNLLPLLENQVGTIPDNRIMYFYKQNEQAIRQGPWFAFRSHPDSAIQLFLIEEDPQLSANLSAVYPAKVNEFKLLLDTLHQPHPWYWNPGDDAIQFQSKKKAAVYAGQYIKRYRPNNIDLMPWERKREKVVFEYQNPIHTGIDPNGLRDCQILRDGDWWYMTGTSYPHWPRQETTGQLNKGVALYRSKDLLNWTFIKYIVERGSEKDWYYRRFWAPEIQKIQGKYYALFNCRNDTLGYVGQWTGYAVADHIEGPYTIVTQKEPLSKGNDLTFFEDDDGKVWAFWNRGREFGIGFAQIDLATATFLTEPTSAIQPAKVEYAYDTKGKILKVPAYDGRLKPKVAKYHAWDAIGIEGAYLLKEKDTYYLFYSSWTRGYEIGYATAPAITGPWTKHPDNPFYGAQNKNTCQQNGLEYTGDPDNPFIAVGHNEIFKGPDGRYWLSCHGIKPDTSPFLVIDPIWFDEQGVIQSDGPTYTPQKIEIKG